MTVSRRDYFAAHALQGIMGDDTYFKLPVGKDDLADLAVGMADALIAALATPPAGQDAPVDAPISVGDLVHYHPVIGEPHDGRVYRVRDVCDIPSIKGAIWLEGKSGCVHPEAVSRASHPPAPDASDLPTPEAVADAVTSEFEDGAYGPTWGHARRLISDAIRADRARRVVGVPVERLREILRQRGPAEQVAEDLGALLAEYAWKEAQP